MDVDGEDGKEVGILGWICTKLDLVRACVRDLS